MSGAGLVARLAAAATPSGGGGSCRCVMPLSRSPGSLGRRLLPALPAPPCRSARWLSCRVSGLSCRSRCSTLGFSRVGGWACRPRLWLAVCRGLRGACRPRLWLAVSRGLCWACCFSVGRTTLNNEFRIVGLFPSSVVPPSGGHTPNYKPPLRGVLNGYLVQFALVWGLSSLPPCARALGLSALVVLGLSCAPPRPCARRSSPSPCLSSPHPGLVAPTQPYSAPSAHYSGGGECQGYINGFAALDISLVPPLRGWITGAE